MLRTRVIPTLLLHGKSLVKTERFGKYRYIGDPANTVRIFNELEVDELCFLDISAARSRAEPDLKLLKEVATECFMPLSYGGGVDSLDSAKKIFDIGYEKLVINTAAAECPDVIGKLANLYGTQAVVAGIDVRRNWAGRQKIMTRGGSKKISSTPVSWARELESRGAGEILLTSIDREGTYEGFDEVLLAEVSAAVDIPVIAHGGAGGIDDIKSAVLCGASAVALGSTVVYQRQGMGVLVHFPHAEIEETLKSI